MDLNIELQRYEDYKIRVCEKNSVYFLAKYCAKK